MIVWSLAGFAADMPGPNSLYFRSGLRVRRPRDGGCHYFP
jgi:hypothetical protein